MASKFMKFTVSSLGGRSIDLPIAGLAGLSAGFVIFSLPADMLEAVVAGTGLPSVLTAAQPPLGQTARIGAAVGIAAAAFTLVYLLLRMLGRSPAEREPAEDTEEAPPPRRRQIVERSEEDEPPAPRLRRWDVHPDAPARRPIFAASEIGEPEPQRSPLVQKKAKPETPFWQPDDFPAVDAQEAEAWIDEQEQAEAPARLPEPEPESRPASPPEPAVASEPPPPPHEPPPPEPAPPRPSGGETIAELMARLEHGLSRRREGTAVPASAPEPDPLDATSVAPPAGEADERLRNAVANLQRLAARSV